MAEADEELEGFIHTFKDKIGLESYNKITTVLKENGFTSRLSLKLLSSENLNDILKGNDLPLGARRILEYHLDLLRDKSPLVLKF